MVKISVDWWKRLHTKQVVKIEKLNHGIHAESEKYFLDLLDEDSIVGCVADKDGDVLGFVMYELFPKHLCIIHLEVDPAYCDCGIEAQMLHNLVVKCQNKHRTHIEWTLPEKNVALQLVLKGLGWKCTKVKRDFFPKTCESGYNFEFLVPEPSIKELPIEL